MEKVTKKSGKIVRLKEKLSEEKLAELRAKKEITKGRRGH